MAQFLAYRGEHGPAGDVLATRLGSFSFSSRDAAHTYATEPNCRDDVIQSPRIIQALITIDRPILTSPDDPFIDMAVLIKALGRPLAHQFALELNRAIMDTSHWAEQYAPRFNSVAECLIAGPGSLDDLYCLAYVALDNKAIVAALRGKGYDGATHRGSGASMDAVEYKVFSATQVRIQHIELITQAHRLSQRPSGK